MAKITAWTTDAEKAFIDRLGSMAYCPIDDRHNPAIYKPTINQKRSQLINYIDSCKHRHDWNGMHRNQCIDYAKSVLSNLQE